MKGYRKLRNKALEILQTELSEDLSYHGFQHTLDVLKVCNQYVKREKIDAHNAKLLRLGALLHDIGFTISNIDHEERGVEIADKLMTELDFSEKDINKVKGLILATRIPQTPKNHLEKIICDADLDYLGRSDFYKISNFLFKELKVFDIINTKYEWDKAQIRFLEAHKYHTDFALKYRQPNKEERIAELKQAVAQ
ncbi:MAG: HD domain-containing protein [Flavobacteriaceae bacterium]|nr:HD domain-containing protein [Flavobacteriaceae bacterium]